MTFLASFVIWIIKNGETVYVRLRKKYLKFLPPSPIGRFPIWTEKIFNLKTNIISKNFDLIIREELDWYSKIHNDVEDSQESIDIANLCKFIMDVEHLEGDIIELGTERGGLTIILAHFLKKIGSKKHIYSCDTFEGQPYDDKYSMKVTQQGVLERSSFDDVTKKIERYDVSDKITLIKGKFEDTLYRDLTEKKFSLVFVDCNLYDSTKFGLEFTYPRLVKEGIIGFDEYEEASKGVPYFGETVAANEFCKTNNVEIILRPIPHIIK